MSQQGRTEHVCAFCTLVIQIGYEELTDNDIAKVAEFVDRAIVAKTDSATLAKIRQEVAQFCKAFPMPH